MNNLIVFSHIPKTAGTSLKHSLRKFFGIHQIDVIYRKGSKNAAYYPKDLKKDLYIYPMAKIITGHCLKPYINFGYYEKKMQWFTFLRPPVKRFISHYVHQQTGSNPNYKMDIKEWSRKFNRRNWMVNMIAGEENIQRAIDIIEEKMEFIGDVENYDLSVNILAKKFGLVGFSPKEGNKKMKGRDNRLKNEILINCDKYIDCIMQNNQLDQKLYEYFLNNIWPGQIGLISEKKKEASKSSKSKLFLARTYRNLVYKPFVHIDNMIS